MGLRLGPALAAARVQGKPGSASLSRGTTRRLLCQCCRRPPERPAPAGQLEAWASPSRGPPWRPGPGNCQLRAPPAGRSPGPGRARAARHRGLTRPAGVPAAAALWHDTRASGAVLSSTVKRPPAWSLRRWPTMAPQAAGQPESEATGTGSCHWEAFLVLPVVPAGGRPQTAGVTPSRIWHRDRASPRSGPPAILRGPSPSRGAT